MLVTMSYAGALSTVALYPEDTRWDWRFYQYLLVDEKPRLGTLS